MSTTEYLSQGRRLNEMIAFLSDRLMMLRDGADRVSALRVSGVKVQQSPDGDAPYVRAMQRIWDMEESIDRKLLLLVQLDRQIGEVIGTLISGDYRMLLRYRYLGRKSWEQIADLMHIDASTAKRWHAKAIALLTLPEDAIFIREAEEDEADLPPAA